VSGNPNDNAPKKFSGRSSGQGVGKGAVTQEKEPKIHPAPSAEEGGWCSIGGASTGGPWCSKGVPYNEQFRAYP